MSMQQAESRGDGGAFGFLTAVDTPTHGLFGGYLVVDSLGRPLEFHCTAPVKVTRAQQILYADEPVLRERLIALAAAVDLREPFERIRAAIDEAQRH